MLTERGDASGLRHNAADDTGPALLRLICCASEVKLPRDAAGDAAAETVEGFLRLLQVVIELLQAGFIDRGKRFLESVGFLRRATSCGAGADQAGIVFGGQFIDSILCISQRL